MTTTDFITIDEVEEITRMKRVSLYRLTKDKKIPHYKIGKRCLFDRQELIDWVKSKKVG